MTEPLRYRRNRAEILNLGGQVSQLGDTMITAAATGAAALDPAVRTQRDVVVIDLQLGVESGLTIIRRIRDAGTSRLFM